MNDLTKIEDPWSFRNFKRNSLGYYDDFCETIVINSTIQQLFASKIFSHEMQHHFQLLTTPYGMFNRWLNTEITSSILRFFNNIKKENLSSSLHVPLVSWVNKLKTEKKLSKASQNLFLQWHHLTRIKKSIEGYKDYSKNKFNLILDSLFNYYSYKTKEYPQSLTLGHLDDKLKKEYGSGASPIIYGNSFGAIHILESLAWIMEIAEHGINAEKLSKKDFHENIKRLSYNRLYQTAILHYIEKTSNNFELVINEILQNPFSFFKYPEAYSFIANAHLSLITPLHYIFKDMYSTDNWYDLHPGWRFVKICNSSLSKYELNYDLSDYEEYQDTISINFNWTRPAHFRSASMMLNPSLFDRNDLDSKSLYRSFIALKLIEEYPWAFVFPVKNHPTIKRVPNELYQKILSEYYPSIITSDFSGTPGWFAEIKNPFLELFKHYYIITMEEKRFVNKLSDIHLKQTFSISQYLISNWIDYIMCQKNIKISDFLEHIFPSQFKLEEAKGYLIFLIDVCSRAYFQVPLEQYYMP